MRKKICIATPVDYGNFGNRLQNYAVHMICKKMGMEPVTLAVEYSFVCGKIPKHRILELIHTFHIGNLISKANRLKSINKSYASWLFTKETIKTVYVENQDELNRMLTQSAYFGIGGDQIFAPYWNEIVWFSMFPECDPNSKICFSPSFGTDSPDRDYLNKIKPELLEIGNLAVREESGCRIAKDLTGKNVHRICDPVVMLSKADWIRAVARKEVSQKETISLVYFLGEYQENYFPKVENEAQKNGWCVIDVSRSSKSISLILCQTEKGVELVKSAGFELEEVDLDKAVTANHQLRHPSEMPDKRNTFFENIDRGFHYAISKCYPKMYYKRRLKTFLQKTKIIGGGKP